MTYSLNDFRRTNFLLNCQEEKRVSLIPLMHVGVKTKSGAVVKKRGLKY